MSEDTFITEDPGKQDHAQRKRQRLFLIKSHAASHRWKTTIRWQSSTSVQNNSLQEQAPSRYSALPAKSRNGRPVSRKVEAAAPDSRLSHDASLVYESAASHRDSSPYPLRSRLPALPLARVPSPPRVWSVNIDYRTHTIISLAEVAIATARATQLDMRRPTTPADLQHTFVAKIQTSFQRPATGYAYLALLASIVKNGPASNHLHNASVVYKTKAMGEFRKHLISTGYSNSCLNEYYAVLFLMCAEVGTRDFRTASIHAQLLCQFIGRPRLLPTGEELLMVEAIMWYDLHRAILSSSPCTVDHVKLERDLFAHDMDQTKSQLGGHLLESPTMPLAESWCAHALRCVDHELTGAIEELRVLAARGFSMSQDKTARLSAELATTNVRAVFLVGKLWSQTVDSTRHPLSDLARLAVVGWYRRALQLERYGLERAVSLHFAVEAANVTLLARMQSLAELSPKATWPYFNVVLWSLWVGTMLEESGADLSDEVRNSFFHTALGHMLDSSRLCTWEEVREVLSSFLSEDRDLYRAKEIFQRWKSGSDGGRGNVGNCREIREPGDTY